MGTMGIDFSYLTTGNLADARWMRKEGSTVYHVLNGEFIDAETGHRALCSKAITGFVVGVTTETVTRSTYGQKCQRCEAKMARIAAAYVPPVQSDAESTSEPGEGESTQEAGQAVSDAQDGELIRHRETGETLRVVTHWANLDGEVIELIVTRDRDECFPIYRKDFPAYERTGERVCPITGDKECKSRECELHYMSAPLKLAPMEIGPRQVKGMHADESGSQTYYWSRTINGTPYAFTFVIMPNGERRYIVQKYNGYCQEAVYKGQMSLQAVLRYACAWTQVHWVTVKARRTMHVPIREVKRGDIVLTDGMRVFIDCDPKVFPYNGTGEPDTHSFLGRVLNEREVIKAGIVPRGWLYRDHWVEGEGWRRNWAAGPRWNVQRKSDLSVCVSREIEAWES